MFSRRFHADGCIGTCRGKYHRKTSKQPWAKTGRNMVAARNAPTHGILFRVGEGIVLINDDKTNAPIPSRSLELPARAAGKQPAIFNFLVCSNGCFPYIKIVFRVLFFRNTPQTALARTAPNRYNLTYNGCRPFCPVPTLCFCRAR